MLEWIALLALADWIYLTVFHGRFWSAALPPLIQWQPDPGKAWPSVRVIIPARDEADVIGPTVSSILGQDYQGALDVVVVDDNSNDETAAIAQQTAREDERLRMLSGAALPAGWAGKVWAMHQGEISSGPFEPEFIWLTDADILHSPETLTRLIQRAEGDQRDLISRMALLRTDTAWEKLLIPAFIYFFQMLYPFRWSNQPRSWVAAAAGGCVLVRQQLLAKIGGVEAIKDALIDDCTLARKIKQAGGATWIELARDSASARGYGGLDGLWQMIARSAYTQLWHNPFVLLACVAGMSLTFLAPIATATLGLENGALLPAVAGLLAFALMLGTFWPMVRFYFPRQLLRACWTTLVLPLTALIYLAATIDSARRYHLGIGGHWKGRAQARPDQPK